MNKDVKGLLIYLLILLIVCLMPTGMVYFVFGVMFYDNNSKLSHLCLMIAISFFILYFLIPIIITHYAIKKHWSIYLDCFFNQWLSPSLVLVILLLLPLTTGIKVPGISETLCGFLYVSYISIVPCYCLIYIVIFWHNLWRLVKNLTTKKQSGCNKE